MYDLESIHFILHTVLQRLLLLSSLPTDLFGMATLTYLEQFVLQSERTSSYVYMYDGVNQNTWKRETRIHPQDRL